MNETSLTSDDSRSRGVTMQEAMPDSDDESTASSAPGPDDREKGTTPEKGPKIHARPSMKAGRSSVELHLVLHKKQKDIDADSRALVMIALKKNRFCKSVSDRILSAICDEMEYFEFGEGDVVIRQGEPGNHFFVISEGTFEVRINDVFVREETRSGSFGGIALLYNTARSATVTSTSASSIWGVRREIFRKSIREHATEHYAENRSLLDLVGLFDGMTPGLKERVGNLALFEESFEPDHVLMRADEIPHAVYIVKSGKLAVNAPGGKQLPDLGKGDCFGWRALLFGQCMACKVVVKESCKLVGVGVSGLHKALGEDLSKHLLTSFVFSVLSKTVIADLPRILMQKLAEVTKIEQYSANEKVKGDYVLTIVIDGETASKPSGGKGAPQEHHRGHFCYGKELQKLGKLLCPDDEAGMINAEELMAGPSGCRLAILSISGVNDAVSAQREVGTPREANALQYIVQMLLVVKVPVFNNLSYEQLDQLVQTMKAVEFPAKSVIFEQGQGSDGMFFVREGRVALWTDGRFVREVENGSVFGERSTILEEPRFVTAKTSDVGVKLWSISRRSLKAAIPEGMRLELAQNMQLHGTNVSLKSLKHVCFIGAGSFGTVRQVEHKSTGYRYALKRIRKKDGEVPEEVTRECLLLAENAHAFLLQYVDKFETEKSIYILTELITGGQLGMQVLDKAGVLPRSQAQFYIGSLAMTLEELHNRRIVHRDVKPENIMLDGSGYVKLVDFGLARKLDDSLPRTYTVAGTVHYMAPEVLEATGYSYTCDIWSLGVVLFEFVCGHMPFGNDELDVKSIAMCIVDEKLSFPSRYADSSGKKLIQGLLNKDADSRLGNGSKGWEEIKTHKYFKHGVSGNLFSKITGRDIEAPFVPEGDEFPSEEDVGDITTSDSEQLGKDDPLDFGCKLLTIFRRFDLNGDGKIDQHELTTVLSRLDPVVFTSEACDQIFSSLETHDGGISYDNFVGWILNEQSSGELKGALVDAAKLDVHS